MDTDDVDFAALRLHATYRKANTDEEREEVLSLVDPLVSVYDVLCELPVRENKEWIQPVFRYVWISQE